MSKGRQELKGVVGATARRAPRLTGDQRPKLVGSVRDARSCKLNQARSNRCAKVEGATALVQLHRDLFEQLVRLSRLRIRNTDDAEDLVQDAFLAVRRAYPDKSSEELRPLLFTTLRNLTLNYLSSGNTKRRRTSVDVFDVYAELACPGTPTPEQQICDKQLLNIAEHVIATMARRRREVLILHRFEQLTFDEIARRLKISSTTANSDLAQAVAEIAEALAQAEVRSGRRQPIRHRKQ